MAGHAVPGSFRDPSGFLFERDGVLRRQVNATYREDYEHLMSSGLYGSLTADGLLVPHEEVPDPALDEPSVFKVLEPVRVPFISYPYEWCFGQYKNAALTTLEIQGRALDHGMSLRDASSYNIQWLGGKPVLIDTLSFERLPEGTPWIAYKQFCQHFLAPIALMCTVDPRLGQLMRVHLDGIPLDLASRLLPGRSRVRPGLQIHIHSHAKSQKRHAGDQARRDDVKGRFSEHAFRGLIESLRSTVSSLEWKTGDSHWLGYYDGDSYTEDGLQHKEELVSSYLSGIRPRLVWDLGANTGRFSRIAAEAGASVVSFEVDPAAVETHFRATQQDGLTGILPLVMDLTDPSPGIGWANKERYSLAERGPADLILALALIHHLAIGGNVPLRLIAAELAHLAEVAVVELVPKDDPKVQVLLGSREDIFEHYNEAGFEEAFGSHFTIERRDSIEGSKRTLYLLRRK
jgi:SAM-dependent methyltransferase